MPAVVTIDDMENYTTDHLAQMAYKTSSVPVITLDNFEYATDLLIQASYPSSDDTWDLLDEDCAGIGDWVDADQGVAVSQVNPAGQFEFDTNASAAPNDFAHRHRALGAPPNEFVIEIRTYFNAIGTLANVDMVQLTWATATWAFSAYFCSDGLYIRKAAGAYGEVGVNIVLHGGAAAWQTWRFHVDKTGGEAAAVVEVFLDDVSQGTVDCDWQPALVNGRFYLYLFGYATNDRICHFDFIRVVTGVTPAPHLQCYFENAILQEGTFSLKGVTTITDSLNDTLTRTVAPTINLSSRDEIRFWIWSSRTGANIKIGIRDGAVTTERTPNIAAANTWQSITWDISGVADADKNAIDRIIITIVNAAADNAFYIDFMRVPGNYLLAYSEDTILTQGSYSLKIVALETDSLNATLTKAFTPWPNISDMCKIRFDLYASRTGKNFTIGFRDHGGVLTEFTPIVLASNSWQEIECEMSQVDNADKDQIDRIFITIIDADEDNTFYIDDMYAKYPFLQLLTLEESMAVGTVFVAGEQTIYRPTPSTDFLTEEALRSNTPAKRIFHYIDDELFDLTNKLISMGGIDKRMTYKPGDTKLLTISDQDLKMSNADQYFSDLNPDSPFHDRDYAGVDRIEIYAGFIMPDTGYAEVVKKADMKLMGIELATYEAHASLRCQDSFRDVFDVLVGMPTGAGVANPLIYKMKTFRWILEDLLVDEAGLSPDIMGIERITQGDLDDDNGDFEGAGADGTDIEVGTDWDKSATTSAEIDNEAGSDVNTFNGSDFCVFIHTATGANPYIELDGADFDAVFTVGKSYRLSLDYKVAAVTSAKIRIFNAGLALDDEMDLDSAAWTTPVMTFTVVGNNNMTLRIYSHDGAGQSGNEEVYADNIEIRQVDSIIDIENVQHDAGAGDEDLRFTSHTFTRQKVVNCIQQIAEVGRGNIVILDDGTVQFRKFVSESTDVDVTLESGGGYSKARYVGQDYLLKVNKVVVIGDTGIYSEAELPGEIGTTLKYENDAIETDAIADDVAADCLGRFAVHPALCELWAEYFPSLELKSVVKLYEPHSIMNPEILQVREISLNLVGLTTRMLLSIPDSAGRAGSWSSKEDWEAGDLTDLFCPDGLNQLELEYGELSGTGVFEFDVGSGAVVNWVFFNYSGIDETTIWRDDFRANSISKYTWHNFPFWNNGAAVMPTYDVANQRLTINTGNDRGTTLEIPGLSVQNVITSFDVYVTGYYPTNAAAMNWARYSNANNCYNALHQSTAADAVYASYLAKHVGGVRTGLASGGRFSKNAWRTLIFEINGTSLKMRTNEYTITTTDGAIAGAGKVLLGCWQMTGYFDNVLVEHYTLPSPAQTSYTFRFRTSDDGIAWSAWTADITVVANSRFIQIEVTLARTDLGNSAMPVLKDMTLGYFRVS